MSTKTSSRFSWNFGAIAGSAIGASLWMPVAAFASDWPAVGISMALATASAIPAGAFLLWRLRQRISAFGGLLILLAVGFSATFVFFAGAEVLDLSLVDRWPGGGRSAPRSYAWVLLLYPALATLFWLLNCQADISGPGAPPNGGPATLPGNSGASGGPPSVS